MVNTTGHTLVLKPFLWLTKKTMEIKKLTFRGTVDNFVFLLRVFQDAFRTEHVSILHAVELYFLLRVRGTHLDLTLRHLAGAQGWVSRCRHWKTRQNLVVNRQIVRVYLVTALVIRALYYAVLGQLAHTL